MRWNIGYFGAKDLFTIINLLGGVFGIYLALKGKLEYAGYAIFAGYVFGDVLDGPIARLTKTANRFGGKFDAAADHLSQAIAPAIIVYAAFAAGQHETLGVVLMAILMITASIRQAKQDTDAFNYPLTYCGLPRTISGLVAISLPNANYFFKSGLISFGVAAGILILVAVLNLVPIPYMTHKGHRKMQTYVKVLVASFLGVPFVLAVLAPYYIYDFLFFITFGYALFGWISLYRAEWSEYWAEYKRWSHQVAVLK